MACASDRVTGSQARGRVKPCEARATLRGGQTLERSGLQARALLWLEPGVSCTLPTLPACIGLLGNRTRTVPRRGALRRRVDQRSTATSRRETTIACDRYLAWRSELGSPRSQSSFPSAGTKSAFRSAHVPRLTLQIPVRREHATYICPVARWTLPRTQGKR